MPLSDVFLIFCAAMVLAAALLHALDGKRVLNDLLAQPNEYFQSHRAHFCLRALFYTGALLYVIFAAYLVANITGNGYTERVVLIGTAFGIGSVGAITAFRCRYDRNNWPHMHAHSIFHALIAGSALAAMVSQL